MTCGASQARRLGMKRVACVSTGNTSASMAAYAAAAGLEALIFLPHGNISFGKLAQALEYGARTLEVEANFDQILALVRVLAERLGIYLLNSMNPFRVEGQKSIVFEMLDQRDWNPPDWIVLPGGNLGNTSAFGKALAGGARAGSDRKDAAAGGDPGRGRGSVLRNVPPGRRAARRDESGDAGDGNSHRRSGLLAQGVARSSIVVRDGGKSHRAGDRRRQGHDRARGHWLRTGFRGDAGGDSQADGGGRDRQGRRRGGGADRATSSRIRITFTSTTPENWKLPAARRSVRRSATSPSWSPTIADRIAALLQEGSV